MIFQPIIAAKKNPNIGPEPEGASMLQRNDGPAQIAAPARDLIKDARPKRSYSRFFVPNSAKIYPSILTEFLQNSHFSLIFIFKFLPSEAPKHKAKHRKWLACLAKQLNEFSMAMGISSLGVFRSVK